MNQKAKLKVIADRDKAKQKKKLEEDKFKELQQQRRANKTLEIGNMKNENQKLADLEQEYLEKLKNTQAKLKPDPKHEVMNLFQKSIFDKMSGMGSTKLGGGKLTLEPIKPATSDYHSATPERSMRVRNKFMNKAVNQSVDFAGG